MIYMSSLSYSCRVFVCCQLLHDRYPVQNEHQVTVGILEKHWYHIGVYYYIHLAFVGILLLLYTPGPRLEREEYIDWLMSLQ